MNEFTKDELKDIKSKYEFLLRIEPYSLSHENFMVKLINKIKYLIDNYCEHDERWGCATCRTFICEQCDDRGKHE